MLLVVTVFALWLGSELNHIGARKKALGINAWLDNEIGRQGWANSKRWRGHVLDFSVSVDETRAKNPSWPWPTIPKWRRLLGDEAVLTIETDLDDPEEPEAKKLIRLFPEATVRGNWPRMDAWVKRPEDAKAKFQFKEQH